MTVCGPPQESAVAHLVFRRVQQPQLTARARTIRHNDLFDIGRKDFEDTFNTREPTISTHHLRFRCVVYEDGSSPTVAPMVYVHVLSSNPVCFLPSSVNPGNCDIVLRKFDGDVLLSDGDVLQLTANISMIFRHAASPTGLDFGLNDIQHAEVLGFRHQYLVSSRRLGFGGQASVFLATKQPSGRQVACKITPWPEKFADATRRLQRDPSLSRGQLERELKSIERRATQLRREFHILQNITHPNIISLEKVICTPNHAYIFEELITGGDLLSFFDQKGAMPEPQAAVIVQQLLKAVEFLHEKGIVHRDIKPENILMTSWRDGARVVLTDFGHSRILAEAKTNCRKGAAQYRMHTTVGTRGYMAPEMFHVNNEDEVVRGYSKAIDLWSIGCITAMLLAGEMPFGDMDGTTSYAQSLSKERPMTWDLSFVERSRSWNSIGSKAKSFVRGCLNVDEGLRMTAEEALEHSWLTSKHYGAEMQAAYLRAIEGWAPGIKSKPFVEFIDSTHEATATLNSDHTSQPRPTVTSPFFNTMSPAMPTAASFCASTYPPSHAIRKTTPLPSLFEDAGQSSSAEHANLSAIQLPSQYPNTYDYSNTDGDTISARFSIEDFAPPKVERRALQEPSDFTVLMEEKLTQSQDMRVSRLPQHRKNLPPFRPALFR